MTAMRIARLNGAAGLLCIAAFSLCGPASWAAEPAIEVTVNRDLVYIGESLIAHVKISGSRSPGEPDLEAVTGCEIKRLAGRDISRRSMVIINGRTRIESFDGYEFIYEVTPEAPGRFVFGPVTCVAEGRKLTGRSSPIEVQDIQKQDTVLIEIEATRDDVLIDEDFSVTMRVLIRQLEEPFRQTDPLIPRSPPKLSADYLNPATIEGLAGPAPSMNDLLNPRVARRTQAGMLLNDYTFSSSPFDLGGFFSDKEAAKFALDRRNVSRGGKDYFEYSITVTYTARELGDYVFGPATLKGNIPLRVDSAGRAETAPIYAVGSAAIVRVVPPPDEGRPESYIGVLGSNVTAVAALDAQTCRVGDPLTLVIDVSGNARFENATLLPIAAQPISGDRFRVYEDAAQIKREEDRVEYTFTVRPQVDGTYELPPIDISYYDVVSREYRTTSTAPLPIRVNPAVQIQAADLIAAETNVTVTLPGTTAADGMMAPISVHENGARSARIVHIPTIAGIAALGPVLFCSCVVVGGIRRALIRRSPERMRRHARSTALRELALAGRTASRDPVEARSRMLHAIGLYVGSLANRPGASIAPPDVVPILRSTGATDSSTAEELGAVFERHYNNHFGGIAPDSGLTDDIANARQAVQNAAAQRPADTGAGVRAIAIVLASSLPGIAAAQDSTQLFAWKQANSMLASAETQEDFLSAAIVYQRLVDNGVRSGPLFYNLGTALLGAKQYDAALEHLLRAERFSGHDDDIRHNLRIAIAKRDDDPQAALPWYRTVLFWHYQLGMSARILVAAIAFSSCWIALVLRIAGMSRWRYVFAGALCAFATFGYSAATDLYTESTSGQAPATWLAGSEPGSDST